MSLLLIDPHVDHSGFLSVLLSILSEVEGEETTNSRVKPLIEELVPSPLGAKRPVSNDHSTGTGAPSNESDLASLSIVANMREPCLSEHRKP